MRENINWPLNKLLVTLHITSYDTTRRLSLNRTEKCWALWGKFVIPTLVMLRQEDCVL
jgi:hypothetical protein